LTLLIQFSTLDFILSHTMLGCKFPLANDLKNLLILYLLNTLFFLDQYSEFLCELSLNLLRLVFGTSHILKLS